MINTQENNDIRNLYHLRGNINVLGASDEFDEQQKRIRVFINEQLLNKNLNIFVGSGCSFPIIPLMGITLKNILKCEKNNKIKEKIELYIKFRNAERQENGNLNIDSFNDIEGFLTWLGKGIDYERNENDILVYNSLKKQFIDTIPMFNDAKYSNNCTIDCYVKFYAYILEKRKEEFPKLNVFTTNYDLFNEYAFEHHKVRYTTGFDTGINQHFNVNQFNLRLVDTRERYKDKWQPTTKEVNLYKLHGSINWIEYNGHLIQSNTSDSDSENAVVYPTALKHQETRQSPYSELFRELSIQLQKPNSTLVIIGYGVGDDHINNIIKQNLANPDFTLIIFGDINESGLSNFRESHSSSNFHIIGGITSGNGHYDAHHFVNIIEYFCRSQAGGLT